MERNTRRIPLLSHPARIVPGILPGLLVAATVAVSLAPQAQAQDSFLSPVVINVAQDPFPEEIKPWGTPNYQSVIGMMILGLVGMVSSFRGQSRR